MPQLFRPPRFPAPLEPSPPFVPASMPCPPPPPPLFRPPRPFPTPLEPSPPLDPASMPIPPPPPVPPLAAKNEERRPWPPMMKKKRPVNREFGSMERAWGIAMIGLHIVICIVMLLSFATTPQESRFWIWLWLYLCFTAIVVMTCVDICYDPPSQQLATAAVVQLPPPPPEMDMC